MKKRVAFGIIAILAFTVSPRASAQEEDTAKPRDLADPVNEELLEELRASPHRLLYERYEGDNWEIFVARADGSDARNLTQTAEVHEFYPQSSPDTKRIAFIADVEKDGGTLRSVWYMNADGTGRRLVAERARQPCWSPDGRRIAFLEQPFERFEIQDFASKGIYFFDIESGETRAHPNSEIEHLYTINWSADGKWIVSTVHAGMGYGHAIVAIEVDGDRVLDLKIPGCRPCLSADSKQVTWSGDDHTINVADIELAAGAPRVTNVRVVEQHPSLHLYHPDFSSDGRYVIFSAGPGGRMPKAGPGTHVQVAEMVGVRGKWNLFVKRVSGEGTAVQVTEDDELSSKEAEWVGGE